MAVFNRTLEKCHVCIYQTRGRFPTRQFSISIAEHSLRICTQQQARSRSQSFGETLAEIFFDEKREERMKEELRTMKRAK